VVQVREGKGRKQREAPLKTGVPAERPRRPQAHQFMAQLPANPSSAALCM
jgi:hypothetical protein